MTRLLAKLLHSVWRDNTNPHRYVVTNDEVFLTEFYADNDKDAMNIFESGEYKSWI